MKQESEERLIKSEERLKESKERLKELKERLKQNIRDTIIANILLKRKELFQNFDKVVTFVKEFIPETEFVEATKTYKRQRFGKYSEYIVCTSNKSSAIDDNDMNGFRFERMSIENSKQMAKIEFQKTQLTEVIVHKHFNGRHED